MPFIKEKIISDQEETADSLVYLSSMVLQKSPCCKPNVDFGETKHLECGYPQIMWPFFFQNFDLPPPPLTSCHCWPHDSRIPTWNKLQTWPPPPIVLGQRHIIFPFPVEQLQANKFCKGGCKKRLEFSLENTRTGIRKALLSVMLRWPDGILQVKSPLKNHSKVI